MKSVKQFFLSCVYITSGLMFFCLLLLLGDYQPEDRHRHPKVKS